MFPSSGMEEASCEKAAYVSTYQDDTHSFSVIQGPAARIRPTRLPEDYFSCKFLLITRVCLPSQHCSKSANLQIFEASFCDLALRLVFLSPVDYEGLVKNLSVCKVFQT